MHSRLLFSYPPLAFAPDYCLDTAIMIVFSNSTIGAIEFTVRWEKDGISHEEWFLGRKINAVNDIFPRGMREALEGKQAGESVTFTYEPRLCIPRFKENQVLTRPLDRLRPKTRWGHPIIPRAGRFYPMGHINGLRDIYPDTLTPFRLTDLTDDHFVADCNHPLANIPVTIKAKIQYLEPRETGTFGSLSHWREKTCDWGPGMQARMNSQPTDFFHPDFFDRIDTSDTQFSPPEVDTRAMENIRAIHARHITPDMRVLDFSLPSPDTPEGTYDAAICTLSIEYLTDPIATLTTVAQHLAPGAPVLIIFSDAYTKNHVTQGWTDLHQFERMGLILEYLRQAGLDQNAETISIRNDWRRKDDPRFMETRGASDPVFVVCGHKQ